MILSHFSKDETITPHSVEQDNGRLKPRGLWVSVDGPDDWPSWCESEGFGIGPNRFRVELTDGPLILDGVADILDFHAEFSEEITRYSVGIDWVSVAQRWPGIIIAPYQWSIRTAGPLWYYGWDCASGCIWDASVITSVERVTEAVTS